MNWLFLILAGLLEVAWPLGLKLAQGDKYRILGFVLAAVGIGVSGFFLYLAQRTIPLGTSYAVWTGIGASGTFFLGVWFFGDPQTLLRYLGVLMILGGVVVLKISELKKGSDTPAETAKLEETVR